MKNQVNFEQVTLNMQTLLAALKKDFDLPRITGTFDEYDNFFKGERQWTKSQIKRVTDHFSNVKAGDVYSTLPDELKVHNRILKLRYLDKFLKDEKGITLARAVSARDKRVEEILSGERQPSLSFISKVAAYFFLPVKLFSLDEEVLPEYKDLQIDEEVCSIQRNDIENTIQHLKHKRYIRRNYGLLSHSLKLKLFFSLAVIIIPLIVFTAISGTMILTDRADALQAYREDSRQMLYDENDESQTQYYNNLAQSSKENDSDAYYCNVYIGTRLHRIYGVNASSSSYSAKMVLFFKFDRTEFHNMFLHYAKNSLIGRIVNDCNADPSFGATEWKDDDSQTLAQWAAIEQNNAAIEKWATLHASEFYPGETTSNNYVDNQTMFDIGNGDIAADTFSYEKDIEYVDELDENGNPVIENGVAKVTCYQRVILHANFNKAFDSPRYPLESVQFKMYIKPTMDAQYMRYIPDNSAVTDTESISGFEPYFAITNGYRLLHESDTIKNFNMRLNYYRSVNTDPAVDYSHTYRTQLEIIVRANRSGVSLFLQAFINIFSVVIWIIIAFYNQSYNNEDSIGMLGTGLFGIISAMLVGLSMMSDAGIISLITLINIFTLAVIMIMTYQSIAAKRANVQQNRVMIAYNGIKLRIMFFSLVFCTLIMFFGLPLSAYLFML